MSDEANDTKKTTSVGIHSLKSHPRYYAGALDGSRPFEIRLDDRGFRVGDKIVLREWDPELGQDRENSGYTGRELDGRITCLTQGADLLPYGVSIIRGGYVVLGIKWSHTK